MRLADFITHNRERIIHEWVRFARTMLPWAEDLDEVELRDHADELLVAVAADMCAPQTSKEQTSKSKGEAEGSQLGAVGRRHAAHRLRSGLNLDQLMSEYRALRASILRLWTEHRGDVTEDETRFHEAIDESLTESIARYSRMLDTTRDQFLAILGHDLRNPLGAITMGASLLMRSGRLGAADAQVAGRVLASARRANRLIEDLLDLTRTRLGGGNIAVKREPMDLLVVCEQVTAELGMARSGSRIRLEHTGDLSGEWDSGRVAQVVSNLVANALQYGDDGDVRVVADGREQSVELQVHNTGVPIPAGRLHQIFEPLIREPRAKEQNATGLGLGLYIARQIVWAHEGTIEATSSAESGTTFTVSLPRHPATR